MNTPNDQVSRRSFLWSTAALTASTTLLRSQERPAAPAPASGPAGARSVVAVTNGASRRQNVYDALVAIEDQILPALRTKKHVVISDNNFNQCHTTR